MPSVTKIKPHTLLIQGQNKGLIQGRDKNLDKQKKRENKK